MLEPNDLERLIGIGPVRLPIVESEQSGSHRDPLRKIRLEIDPLMAPSTMTRASELLEFGPEARLQTAPPASAGLFDDQLGFEAKTKSLKFAVKRHRATRLHTDFRFEAFGVLLSWASYDKPSLDPRKAIRLREMGDHHPKYMRSERRIPDGSYGAGPMIVWDEGIYRPLYASALTDEEAIVQGLRSGRLEIWVEGQRVRGGFRLKQDERGWSLRKLDDLYISADEHDDVSVISGRTLDHIEREYQTMVQRRSAG